MSVNSSFPKVADQVISFNKNLVDTLAKINTLTTTSESSVDVQIFDEEGVLRNYTLPSFTSLKGEIDRLNNNINSLYSIDADGSMIQQSGANKFKKIITVDLNRDPNPVNDLGLVDTFKTKPNWFFDSMIDPMLQVEFDLSSKIENNVSKCLVRRYIVEFERTNSGELTSNGQSALNSFNQNYRGNSDITFSAFEEWYTTTPGIANSNNIRYDEEKFDLEPNTTMFDGEFSVIRTDEDRLNRKLWYVFNTLDYININNDEVRELAVDDEVIVNSPKTSTRYRVIEISKTESSPRVRLERVEGIEAIPIGIGTLKIYSPVIYNKKIRASIGYNERNVLFLKPINTENNLVAKKWSSGTGFYTNDLRLSSDSDTNGLTMEQFYTEYVYDYGKVLEDLVAKKIPNSLGVVPQPPALSIENFKVVQVNRHLSNTNTSELRQKSNYQSSLKSEVKQLEKAIIDRNKKIKITRFKSESDKKQSSLELKELISKKENKSKLLNTVTKEIIDITRGTQVKSDPKYRLRGFWDLPQPISRRGTLPQEVIQFKIQYRYVSLDGEETPIEQFDLSDSKASFSNWENMKTDIRDRVFDSETGEYFWAVEDVSDPDTPNINQLDIPIRKNERVEFRIKSISEVGYPDSPIESEWSEIISFEFPEEIDNENDETENISRDALKEDVIQEMNTELDSKGLDEHLSDQLTINSKTYHHEANKILSGFKDDNGVAIDLFQYLRSLEDKIRSLEERISRTRGLFEAVILRNNQEFVIGNGGETSFNIDCEDYLTPYTNTDISSGRVYENNIYVIKDFVIRIRNNASESPLGLLSDKNYTNNSNVYRNSLPQVFWVDEQDELLKNDTSGGTRTQLDNQYVWSVNFDTVSEDSNSKVSENIGNDFRNLDSNSLTNVLSSPEFNLGYLENIPLSFVGNNDSLLENSKWIDRTTSVDSTNKLLTSIHPVVKDLETIRENNSNKVKTIDPGEENDIIIPINIYFKMNALDNSQSGENFEYIDLTRSVNTIKHSKKVKFLLENESENRPFTFTVNFNINRNKLIVKKVRQAPNRNIR
jgi:hypothetical protein